jgi:hypothetical protein
MADLLIAGLRPKSLGIELHSSVVHESWLFYLKNNTNKVFVGEAVVQGDRGKRGCRSVARSPSFVQEGGKKVHQCVCWTASRMSTCKSSVVAISVLITTLSIS